MRGPESTGTGARLIVALAAHRRRAGDRDAGAVGRAAAGPTSVPARRSPAGRACASCGGPATPACPIRRWRCAPWGSTRSPACRRRSDLARLRRAVRRSVRAALAFLARRALRAAIDRAVDGDAGAFLKTAVLGDRRGVGARRRGGLSRRGRHPRPLGVGAAPGGGGGAALSPRARGGGAGAAASALRRPAGDRRRGLAAGDRVLHAVDRRGGRDRALGADAGARNGRAAWSGGAASPGPTIAGGGAGAPGRAPAADLRSSRCSCRWPRSPASPLGARGIGPARAARRSLAHARCALALAFRSRRRWRPRSPPRRWCAHHFGEIAPLSPLGNLALVPLVELVVVPVGLAGAVAGAIWAPLGRLPLRWPPAGARARRWRSPAAFARTRPLWVCRAPNVARDVALIAAGCLALVAPTARGGRRRAGGRRGAGLRGRRRSAWSSATLRRRRAETLTVTFLDVGQGDAAVVEAPGGAVMLIDGGGTRDGQFDTGRAHRRAVPASAGDRPPRRRRAVAPASGSSQRAVPDSPAISGRRLLVERRRRAQPRVPPPRSPWPRPRGVPAPEVAPTPLGARRVVPLGPFLDGRIARARPG